jgi:hypothetical protein
MMSEPAFVGILRAVGLVQPDRLQLSSGHLEQFRVAVLVYTKRSEFKRPVELICGSCFCKLATHNQ